MSDIVLNGESRLARRTNDFGVLYFVDENPEFRKSVMLLKGKRLGCYCKPKECHGDVIKEWIKSQTEIITK